MKQTYHHQEQNVWNPRSGGKWMVINSDWWLTRCYDHRRPEV